MFKMQKWLKTGHIKISHQDNKVSLPRFLGGGWVSGGGGPGTHIGVSRCVCMQPSKKMPTCLPIFRSRATRNRQLILFGLTNKNINSTLLKLFNHVML